MRAHILSRLLQPRKSFPIGKGISFMSYQAVVEERGCLLSCMRWCKHSISNNNNNNQKFLRSLSSLQHHTENLGSCLLGPDGEQHQFKASTMIGTQSTRGFSVEAENGLSNIQYRIASPSQYEDVVRLLYSSFFTDEPMSKCLKLTDGVTRAAILDEFVYAGLAENLTITALDGTTGKLLGACINVTATKKEIPETLEEYIGHYKDDSFRHIIHVLYNVNRDGGDIFGEMDSNILFDIKMLATDKHNRKGGLATDLLRRSVDLAKCLGFRGIKTEATGLYSRKAFQRLGFEIKAECIYEDFVTVEGENIFVDAKEPHRCTTLMTKKI